MNTSCTEFDPLDSTGETLNRNATDYANDAVLMNVIRSELSEPLSFITVTGVTGVSSVTGSLGFGGFTFGPHTSVRDYLLGPNSVSRTNSNSFNVSVVDDPASFAALLAPVNPALIGFFMNQGYPRELLFFLFTERLRKVKEDDSGRVTEVVDQFFNNPNDGKEFGKFLGEMGTLLNRGLIAEIDITSSPSGRAMPPSKFCMDPSFPLPSFVKLQPTPTIRPTSPSADSVSLCENAPWISTQSSAAGGTASGVGGSSNSVSISANGTILETLGTQSIVRILPNGDTKTFSLPAPPKPSKKGSAAGLAAYEFDDGFGNHYQLFTRSTYGAYDYVGSLRRNQTDLDIFPPDGSGYQGVINIVSSPGPCFAEVNYRSIRYCVPEKADRTKRVFALLHELQQLSTAPSNAPSTLTLTPIQ
jgi:hypothetical protein